MQQRSFEYLKDLTLALTLKELRSKYKSATLGFLWILINPLIQMAALTIVFSFFLKLNVKNYPIFVFSGLLPWTYFSLAIQSGTSSLIANRELIKKTPFPKAVLPISSVFAHLLTFSIAISLLLFYSLIFFGFSLNYILLVPIILIQTILTVSLSLLLSSLDVYYRDVSFILSAILIIWFYITPVFYPLSMVPKAYHFLYNLNPMVGIITSYQAIFLKDFSMNYGALLISIIETIFFLFLGIILFKKRSKYFADWV